MAGPGDKWAPPSQYFDSARPNSFALAAACGEPPAVRCQVRLSDTGHQVPLRPAGDVGQAERKVLAVDQILAVAGPAPGKRLVLVFEPARAHAVRIAGGIL